MTQMAKIESIRFYLHRIKNRSVAAIKARLFDPQKQSVYSVDPISIGFPIEAIWIDPSNATQAMKAYLGVPKKEPQESLFRFLCQEHRAPVPAVEDLMAFQRERRIRYGPIGSDVYSGTERISYDNYEAFNSLGLAVQSLIKELSDVTPIGGVEVINLNSLPDSAGEALGFVKAEEYLGVGLPMWVGNPTGIALGRGGSRYYRGKRMANATSVADLLEHYYQTKETQG